MTSTLDTIREAESKWIKNLFFYNQSQFKNAGIPSHNHWHHLRVWHYIRELIESLNKRGITYSMDETEGLIIAAFFHDIAMHRTFDEVHGKWGAEQCRSYFAGDHASSPCCFPQVLEAIERHDDKRYLNQTGNERKPGLGALLAAADDLDAFGAPGIIRYAEILMLRGFNTSSIPAKVLGNARSRMDHFSILFAPDRYMVHKHQKRHGRVESFFQAILDATDQGKINRAILDRIRENLNQAGKPDKLTQLLEPADSPALNMLHQEAVDELKAFDNPLF